MPLQPTEVHDIDKVTGKLKVVRGNPTRGYLVMGEHGLTHYYFQDGQYFRGPNECDENQVPKEFRDEIAAHPLTSETEPGVLVVKTCPLCGEKLNASAMEQHYLGHAQDRMSMIGRPVEPKQEKVKN